MHFCTAHVAIGGDPRNIMYRDPFAPVSWPEVDILRIIHGDDAVSEIIPFVEVKQAPHVERQRLAMIYGDEPCATRWGGRSAPTELNAPGVKQKPGTVWKNPLSGRFEQTLEKGSAPYEFPVETRAPAEIVGDYALREAQAPDPEPEDDMYRDDPEDLIGEPTVVVPAGKKK